MNRFFHSCSLAESSLLSLLAGRIPRPAWFIMALLGGLLKPAEAQDPFTRITSGPTVSGLNSTILAWGDFNNDDFQDLFVSTRTGPSLLYSNNGNGTFSRVLAAPIATDSGSCFGATWGDYDNDGYLDLFVGVNSGANDWLYHNNGQGGFTKILSGAIVTSGGYANNCGWADYDNDGFLDLFVANSDQNDFLYHNNGNGTFARILTNAIALKPGNSQGGSWGDYDNDGLPDLFVSRINEPNLLYHNDGHGIFSAVTNGPIVHDVSVGQGTSWGDYDNDGYLDLFVVNPNAPNFLYRNNRDGTFQKITSGAIVTDIADGHGCGWADYDNDGNLDLYVANRQGPNFLYRGLGDGTFSRVPGTIVATDAADAIAAAWADYDNDGFPDLFVTELNGFNNRLYRNNGNTNAWLTLKLEGRRSNRSAIGAKVRLRSVMAGRVVGQFREISGGGGLGSQNDLRAAFGLGDATNVDLVRVEWPAGTVQELRDLAPRQFLKVVEPETRILPTIQEAQPGQAVSFTLTPNTSLPAPLHVRWQHNGLELPGETNATLIIQNTEATDAGTYTAVVSDPATGQSFTPPPARLNGPVLITQQPRSLNVRPGSNVVFKVVATGLGSLTYQWRWNEAALPFATNATFVVTNAQMDRIGNYDVVVANIFGPVVSTPAWLDILVNPIITVQPLSQSTVVGGRVTFSAAASGHPAPFTFEWRRGTVGIWTNTTTESMSFLTLTNIQSNQAGNYRVVIKNPANFQPGLITSNAVLTILPDTDADGLPDEWESSHGLNTASASDAVQDTDADGAGNWQEYLAGTDPADPASCLRIDRIDWSPDAVALQFIAVSNKTYTVQSRPAFTVPDAIWTRVADVPAASTNRTITINNTLDRSNNPRFYRLTTPRVADQP
jgi:hypothetical protein